MHMHVCMHTHKVIIVGDSHARRGAAEVKHLLNNKFEVQGMVKSGSGMELIKETTRAEINYQGKM